MKESVGISPFMYPCPVVAVGTNAEGKPNLMTVAWTGVVNSNRQYFNFRAQGNLQL